MHSFWKTIVSVLMVLGWTAAAQAVPVDLLKPAVPFDVACDGAVDEAAMLNVVRCWIEECNIELSAIGESDEKHIIRSLLDMDEMPLRGCPACFLILKGVVISSHETNRFS